MTDYKAGDNSWMVLLVDDQPANLEVLRGTLQEEGYELAFAATGEDALGIVPELKPDLILLDVMMPGIDGFETCRRLKKSETGKGIPVVFVTARTDTPDLLAGFDAGGIDYITKPFQHEEVRARVRSHMELITLRRTLETQVHHTQELLEQTLTGSLNIFHQVLAGFDPNLFNHAARLRQLVKECGSALGFEDTTTLEIAAMFLPLGLVTLPPDTIARYRENRSLSPVEKDMLIRVPEAGARLLEKIPHLKAISKIVRFHQKGYDGSGFPEDGPQREGLPIESRVLKLLSDFVFAELNGLEGARAVERLEENPKQYDPFLMAKFRVFIDRQEQILEQSPKVEKSISFEELKTGLVLADKIENKEGMILLNPGQTITELHMMLLKNHKEFVGIKEPILVLET
ncbi:response regulator [Nitrospina sp. 32_T5]|uniref:response regulator n=1 Tax=unclassified Nitrospina TaxID=2638683 RepID=UPI003F970315